MNQYTDLTSSSRRAAFWLFRSVFPAASCRRVAGDTLWGLENVAAYEALSPPFGALLDGLTAEHNFEILVPAQTLGNRRAQGEMEWARSSARIPPVIHPVVRAIEDGRRIAFVNSGLPGRILELTEKRATRCSPPLSGISPPLPGVHGPLVLLPARRGFLRQPAQHPLRNARLPLDLV